MIKGYSILDDTLTHDKYKQLRKKNKTIQEIADYLHVSKSCLERWLRNNDIHVLEVRGHMPLMPDNKRIAIYKELTAQGLKRRDIYKHLKFKNPKCLTNWLNKMRNKGINI